MLRILEPLLYFDRFSVKGQFAGKDYKFMYVIQDKNTFNIFSTGASEELMTKEEMRAVESIVSIILEKIKK